MPYDRWRMTVEAASTLTGVDLTAEDLERAEDEIRDEIGWTPDPARYDDGVPAGIGGESVGGGDYAVTYTGGGPTALTVSPRTVELLRGAGWYARTSTGTARI